MLRSLRNRLLNSPLGFCFVDAIIRGLGYEVFSPRTMRAAQFDALRLRARNAWPRRDVRPEFPRLHLGCGTRLVEGWVNADVVGSPVIVDLASGWLPWADSSFDAVVSQHVIEHLELHSELLPLLRGLKRVMRPGGEIWLSCPDLEKACRGYTEDRGAALLEDFIRLFPTLEAWRETPQHMINSLFQQDGEHRNLFDAGLLTWALREAGFTECRRVTEPELLGRFPEFPPRGDDYHSLYLSAIR